ncbi:saccharopine dehydrogenase family protein [Nitratireductor soli]|uniref:saccharopine dehydrogenase family protein n=1 Tax=Nitratireductor soli TaxID=1670619 RepID=UPI00065E38F9|nr:saccharopine dehydrogenase NADP-binding domain-containing protein [Nitratireductor soli]
MAIQLPLKIAIVGAGSVGLALAEMLRQGGDWSILLADSTEEARRRAESSGFAVQHVDASQMKELRRLVAGQDVVVAAVPDPLTPKVAAAAMLAGAHYLDFSNASAKTEAQRANLAADRFFLSGCGVSPGLVDEIAASLAGSFRGAVDLTIRVGAIPRQQTNRLGYGLIWNLDGLLAEYTAPCEAIVDGQRVMLEPLSQKEDFVLDGIAYEAFCTSGGVSTLIERIGQNVRNLVFRTIRYPGHLDYISFLLDDLGLRQRRDLLMTVLRNGLPKISDDQVLIFVSARGFRHTALVERSVMLRVGSTGGRDTPTALALGSAAHAAGLLDAARRGTLVDRAPGANRHRDLAELLDTRFLTPLVTWTVHDIALGA